MVAFFAVLTFASTTVMLADVYYAGPNTKDLQGQWLNTTTTPPGGPPVYGTPGPGDDADLGGYDITASGGSVRSIFDLGSLTVTGMASTVEASLFTLRGSGTLNVDHVDPNNGLRIVGGHLKASGAADFVDVSGGGVVTAATCKGGSFQNASSLTLTTPAGPGSASFFSASSLTAKADLDDFTLTLRSGSLAHVSAYSIGNVGSVSINDPGSALTVDKDFLMASGNFNISSGGAATVNGQLRLSGGAVSINGGGSKLTTRQDLLITRGDFQMNNGGIGTVMGELQMSHGHVSVRDAGSSLIGDRFTIGGDPSNAAAIIDVDAAGMIIEGGFLQSTIAKNGVVNVQDGRTGVHDNNLEMGLLVIQGGALYVTNGGAVSLSQLIMDGPLPGTVGVSDGICLGLTIIVQDGSTVSADGVSLLGATTLVIQTHGAVSVSGPRASMNFTSARVADAGSKLFTSDKSYCIVLSKLTVDSGGVVSTVAGGTVDVGDLSDKDAPDAQIRVGAGGWLADNGAVTCVAVNVLKGGMVSGTGTINGKTFSSGQFFPGNSPGILRVQGDYTQNSDGLLGIEIGGTNSGTGYDQLQVSGTATIAGSLQVRLMNGFTPTVGQTYRIVNAGSFSGGFSSITQPSQAGISVSNDAGGVTVTITSVVAGAPVISSPTTVAATQGQAFSYQITATNNPTSFGAMNLPDGLTVNQTNGLISGTPTKAGNYIAPMAANNAAGSGQADLVIGVSPPAVPKPSQLLNISTRMRVLTGDNVLIGGFIITGTEPKKVILRGIGPSLNVNGTPIPGRLTDPTLELHLPDGTVIANDNWKINAQTGQSQEADIRATTIPPPDDLESAIIATLPPGNYSAVLAGKNQTSGIGVVEVYDLAQAADSQLANISSRGFVDTDDNVMIGGFIVGGGTGGGNAHVIVRALGPSVPVPNTLGDPTLDLYDASGTIITSNDNWKTRPDGTSQQAVIEATTIPPANDLESALVARLPPGNYTAIVRGKNNTTGVGLVEVYELP
jgi:hypothetical protein